MYQVGPSISANVAIMNSRKPFSMAYKYAATDIEFRSNSFEGSDFGIKFTNNYFRNNKHKYSVYWTLKVKVVGLAGKPVGNEVVTIIDRHGKEVARKKTGADGTISEELLVYKATASKKNNAQKSHRIERIFSSPYTVKVADRRTTVKLTKNTEVTIKK